MNENQILTLKDLRKYLEEKYESEWKGLLLNEIINKQNAILSKYKLTQDEYEYAAPIKTVMEEQSVTKTMINTKKAQKILVKRK